MTPNEKKMRDAFRVITGQEIKEILIDVTGDHIFYTNEDTYRFSDFELQKYNRRSGLLIPDLIGTPDQTYALHCAFKFWAERLKQLLIKL